MLVLFSSITEKKCMKTGRNYTLRSLLGAELHFEVNLAKEIKRKWAFKQKRRVFLEKETVLKD